MQCNSHTLHLSWKTAHTTFHRMLQHCWCQPYMSILRNSLEAAKHYHALIMPLLAGLAASWSASWPQPAAQAGTAGASRISCLPAMTCTWLRLDASGQHPHLLLHRPWRACWRGSWRRLPLPEPQKQLSSGPRQALSSAQLSSAAGPRNGTELGTGLLSRRLWRLPGVGAWPLCDCAAHWS